MVWPLWATRYLPIEDLPQHIAAIRVLHSFRDPAFGFERYFSLELFHTQYLAYYLLADGLAYLVDLELGNRLIMVACAAATPFALRYVLRALGRPDAFALFALPLTYNAHLILGFVNFLMAIPAALFGLGLCAQQVRAPANARAVLLAAVAVFCFFCHVVPFAFLVLGWGLLALARSPRVMALRLAPLAPAVLCALLWVLVSPAGKATRLAAHGGGQGPQPTYQPAELALRDLPNWLTDTFHGPEGVERLRYLGWLFALTLVLGLAYASYCRWIAARGQSRPLGELQFLRLLPLAPLALIGYFVLPTGYDWIWPIAQRFPLLALLFLVPVLPRPPKLAIAVCAACLLALSWVEQARASKAFAAFDAEEVGELDRALAAIPIGKRVMGLIFDRGSRYVKFSPFIHAVAYYQARRGGAVMFSFADFPQSPFRFLESNRPPRVRPRWEWLPQLVRAGDLPWYEYLLVRSGTPPCAARSVDRRGRSGAAPACQVRLRAGVWSVWQLTQ